HRRARRHDRQCRRAWSQGRSAPGAALVPQYRHHHTACRHGQHTNPAEGRNGENA
ncbi:unnamed protein product, partial [Adineta ricciae]